MLCMGKGAEGYGEAMTGAGEGGAWVAWLAAAHGLHGWPHGLHGWRRMGCMAGVGVCGAGRGERLRELGMLAPGRGRAWQGRQATHPSCHSNAWLPPRPPLALPSEALGQALDAQASAPAPPPPPSVALPGAPSSEPSSYAPASPSPAAAAAAASAAAAAAAAGLAPGPPPGPPQLRGSSRRTASLTGELLGPSSPAEGPELLPANGDLLRASGAGDTYGSVLSFSFSFFFLSSLFFFFFFLGFKHVGGRLVCCLAGALLRQLDKWVVSRWVP
jgi:hypothetical protein